jgi:HAD superfamily hydrolase (TIGR01509 family)
MTTLAVLFDMDGVLVDSASLHLRAYEIAFREAGLDFPDAARLAVLRGKARSHVLDLALPGAEAELKRRLSEAKPEALKSVLANEAPCSMPGALETVLALSRAGVLMGVVTNSRTPEMWIEKTGISSHLKVLVTGNDVSNPKPSAEGYVLGARWLGVSPDRCLAVEDSLDGWTAAKSAGMRVAVVAGERPDWVPAQTEVMVRLDAVPLLRILGRDRDV